MDDYHIELLRELATNHQDLDPVLSFKILSVLRQYKVNGPVIEHNYGMIKESSGLVNCVVIGNCQVQPLANILESKNNELYVTKRILVHEGFDIDLNVINGFDIILTHYLKDNFGDLSTINLKKKFGNKVVVIPNIFYQGDFTDWFYFPIVNNIRLKGPLGDYHHREIVRSYIKGENKSSAKSAFEYSLFGLKTDSMNNSIQEFIDRQKNVDVDFIDYFKKIISAETPSFHTFNHPKKFVLNELANRILNYLGLSINNQDTLGAEVLDSVILNPKKDDNNNSIFKGYDLKFLTNTFTTLIHKQKYYSSVELIDRYYDVYDTSTPYISKVKNII